ncbi:GerMN domain-containing protein [Marisediminicola senii]|uniref:GerMN domain-containing protein n=1 Tax=Marisediminicola senii TaxID=2711233 RepID=UPI0013EB8585|nr:GerMN domain-containing protein [Marisediminicola senii]
MHRAAAPTRPGLVLVAMLLAMLTGCVGIPTGGPVTEGQEITEEDAGDFDFFPVGPVDGASQSDILRGFVAAFTGSANDYSVARQFLSSGFADEWNPRASVTVRDANERLSPVDDDTIAYSVNASATVNSSGAYRQNADPVPVTLPFDFVLEDDQWRISAAENGIVLADVTFRAIFDQHSLYFLDPTNEYLVPDIRWFASGTATLRIVAGVLDGPPDWLQGAVRTAFPDGTQLADPQVDIESSVAIVDLSTEALGAEPSERQLMQLQLSTSLATVPNVRGVSISVSGTPLEIPELAASAPVLNPQVDDRPVVLRGDDFGYLSGDSVTSLRGLGSRVVETSPRAAATDGDSVAVLGAAGVSLVRPDDAPTVLLDDRAGLVAPTIDHNGFVWSGVAGAPQTLRISTADGTVGSVDTGLSSDLSLVSVDLSRDGTRLAMLLSNGSVSRLVIKAVNRDASRSQLPVALSESVLDISLPAGSAIDATWVDDRSVAVLTAARDDEGEQGSVSVFELGGERSSLGQPGIATALIGGNGPSGLRALGADSTILARSGVGWTDTGDEVTLIATQY